MKWWIVLLLILGGFVLGIAAFVGFMIYICWQKIKYENITSD